MLNIFEEYNIPSSAFTFLPIQISSSENHNMLSTDLSAILENGTILARNRQKQHCSNNNRLGHVIFLGMDSPEIPLDELIAVANHDVYNHKLITDSALLLPAADGGYGMLAVPLSADPYSTFHGVLWSNPLTAISQIKALTDQSIVVVTGRLMYDIDEPQDVNKLCDRLRERKQLNSFVKKKITVNDNLEQNNNVLSSPSPWVQKTRNNQTIEKYDSIAYSYPKHTCATLEKFGLLTKLVEHIE